MPFLGWKQYNTSDLSHSNRLNITLNILVGEHRWKLLRTYLVKRKQQKWPEPIGYP